MEFQSIYDEFHTALDRIQCMLFDLISSSSKNFVDLGKLSGAGFLRLLSQRLFGLLSLIEFLGLSLSLCFQSSQQFLVLPPDAVSQNSNHGIVSALLEAHDSEGGRNDNTLLLVIRSGDSVKRRQTRESLLSTSRLLVNHTPDCAPHHQSRALEVEGALTRVGVHVLLSELSILDTVSDH